MCVSVYEWVCICVCKWDECVYLCVFVCLNWSPKEHIHKHKPGQLRAGVKPCESTQLISKRRNDTHSLTTVSLYYYGDD